MDIHRTPQHPTVVPLRRAPQRHPLDDGSGLRFGRFRLLPAARLLLRDDREVDLGGRAFELLQVFLASPGLVLSKAEITKRVWSSTKVEEGNLRFQICCLRRALKPDADLIRTVAGRGYLFAGTVEGETTGNLEDRLARQGEPDAARALAEALEACDALRRQLGLALDRLAR